MLIHLEFTAILLLVVWILVIFATITNSASHMTLTARHLAMTVEAFVMQFLLQLLCAEGLAILELKKNETQHYVRVFTWALMLETKNWIE